ncbi:MAG: hypothetical protein K2K31_02430 [Clostridia bacterium]|nr:hypothetical protein [Clostridia bacterium]
MKFNPFLEKPKKLESCIMSWKDLAPKSYDKNEVSPYTRVRCILMNGTEYEAVWFGHAFNRHCNNNDLRRVLGMVRRQEQQQQKLIASLKPVDENLLETTIGYEQLAVDLTAFLAQHVKDQHVKDALDFALLEDFDHLYRYADLLESDMGEKAEKYVGGYTEITPGRPTISHHRHPYDEVKAPICNKKATPFDKCAVSIITAAEQQTMNYYMNLGAFYKNQKGRELYTEIGMVEEQHVSQYGSLIDPNATWLESCLMHEYIECYLYYSMMQDESDKNIKKIWEMILEQEIAHLHAAVENLKKYEKKDWQEVIPNGEFPELIKLQSNIEYVRKILKNTVTRTAKRESYVNINELEDTDNFFKYQNKVNAKPEDVASHKVIVEHINKFGKDYRFETKQNPVKELQDRKKDNFTLGRVKEKISNSKK